MRELQTLRQRPSLVHNLPDILFLVRLGTRLIVYIHSCYPFDPEIHFLEAAIAHFPMSPLTLRPLHGRQTSQGKCARVAPTFDLVHESHAGVTGGARSGDMLNLPDHSSSNRRRENYP